jgi:hypothetical protein
MKLQMAAAVALLLCSQCVTPESGIHSPTQAKLPSDTSSGASDLLIDYSAGMR